MGVAVEDATVFGATEELEASEVEEEEVMELLLVVLGEARMKVSLLALGYGGLEGFSTSLPFTTLKVFR